MPQVFKIDPYWVYFWANESEPLEPIHVHVSEGTPSANATGEMPVVQQQFPNS